MNSEATDWFALTPDGDLSKWVTGPAEDFRVEGDTLIFLGPDVRAEVGGMSWDNYILGADVLVRRDADDAYFQVELAAVGSSVYCQLLPQCVNLAYYSHEKEGTAILCSTPVNVESDRWYEFLMKAQAGRITAFLDGGEIAAADSPNGTAGMPGFIVKCIRNAEPRIRNVQISFLSPTPKQLEELELDARTNWRNYQQTQKTAQPGAEGDAVTRAP